MKLLLDSQRHALLANGESSAETGKTANTCVVKFFLPSGRYTFYAFDASPEPNGDLRLFGFCVSPLGPDCDEWGYTMLSELAEIRDAHGLHIERDRHFPGVTREGLQNGLRP